MAASKLYGPVIIVLTHDGCVVKDLTLPIPSWPAVRRTWRELKRMGYAADDMSLVDVETGRAISFVVPA
jgi:hypothetical protein